jgi:hypothetical protein
VLDPTVKVRVPRLPERAWNALTVAWWRDIWHSPMAAEYMKSDHHGLFILAALVDKFWEEPSEKLAAEIRQQRQCFGLTPLDRRRLQWTVQKVEEGEKRKAEPDSAVEPVAVSKELMRALA